jgi:hypothetical protein
VGPGGGEKKERQQFNLQNQKHASPGLQNSPKFYCSKITLPRIQFNNKHSKRCQNLPTIIHPKLQFSNFPKIYGSAETSKNWGKISKNNHLKSSI